MWVWLTLGAAMYGVGPETCVACHKAQALPAAHNPLSRALLTAKEAEPLRDYPQMTFTLGKYRYEIRRQGGESLYSVTDGQRSFSTVILWAFGAGEIGQTYMVRRDGVLYETRVSYYPRLKGLQLTIGAPAGEPLSLDEAIGRPLNAKDERECFGCHTTQRDLSKRFRPDNFVAGVQCGHCHGPVDKHLAAIQAGDRTKLGIEGFRSTSSEEMSEFCGSCHRTWSFVQLIKQKGIQTLRFQPYRLTNSRCYDAMDTRISCVACHDVHRPVVKEAAYYDPKCTACHSASGGRGPCKAGEKTGCVTCHMPKLEVPGAFAKFTDHQIRVVRAGAPVPD